MLESNANIEAVLDEVAHDLEQRNVVLHREARDQLREVLAAWVQSGNLHSYLDRDAEVPKVVYEAAREAEADAFLEQLDLALFNNTSCDFPGWDELPDDITQIIKPEHLASSLGVTFDLADEDLARFLGGAHLSGAYEVLARARRAGTPDTLTVENAAEYESFGHLWWASGRPLVDFSFPKTDSLVAFLNDNQIEVSVRAETLSGVLRQPTINSSNEVAVDAIGFAPYEVVEDTFSDVHGFVIEDYHPSVYRELANRAIAEGDDESVPYIVRAFVDANRYRDDPMNPKDHVFFSWCIEHGHAEGNAWEHLMAAAPEEEASADTAG